MRHQRIFGCLAATALFCAWFYQDLQTARRKKTADPVAMVQKEIQKGAKLLHKEVKKLALNVPKEFGKKHFIVGYQNDEQKGDVETASIKKPVVDEPKREGPYGLICEGKVRQVFFAPDANVQKALMHLIDTEKKKITIAMYTFTDADVAKALIRASERGVTVEVLIDGSCLQERYNKIGMMRDKKVRIYVYDLLKQPAGKQGIMHNKFVIFSRNLLDRSVVWTGSYNFTRSAYQRNQENAVVSDESWLVARYEQQFEKLKKQAVHYALESAYAIA